MEGSGRNDFLMKRHRMHLRLGTVISLQWMVNEYALKMLQLDMYFLKDLSQ